MNEDLKLILADEEAPKSIDPMQSLVVPLWRSRRWIAGLGFVGAVIGLFMGITKPNAFESTGKLLVNAGAREAATPETALSERGSSMSGNRNAVTNEVHLLNSPEVYEKAARKLGPDRILEPYAPRASKGGSAPHTAALHAFQRWWFARGAEKAKDGTPEDQDARLGIATKILMQSITIEPEPFSSVITVRYATHSQKLARDVVEAFLQAADEYHRDVYSSESILLVMNEERHAASLALIEKNQEFTNYRKDCGIWEIEQQTNETLQAIAQYEEDLDSAKRRKIEIDAERLVLAQELAKLDDTIETRGSGGLKVGSVGDATATANPVKQGFQTRSIELSVEFANLEVAVPSLEEQILVKKADLVALADCSTEHGMLSRDAQQAQARLASLSAGIKEIEKLSMLDNVGMSNLRLIQPATYPLGKKGPKRSKLLIMGTMLGLAFGLGIGFMRKIFDHRLHSPVDVERKIAAPILAVIPENRAWRATTKNVFRVLPGEPGSAGRPSPSASAEASAPKHPHVG